MKSALTGRPVSSQRHPLGRDEAFPPVFYSSRELSSINDESALVTCALSMITRDSRRKPGGRLHHALEDVVGLKQGAFHRLASTTSCARKLLKALLEIARKPSNSRLQISTRVACCARMHVMMLHSELCAAWLSLSDVTGKKNFAH